MRLAYWLNGLLLATVLYGQDAQRQGTPTVRAQGEAVIRVKPDVARLDVGVVTQAQTAEAAAAENAKRTAAVMATLKKELGANAEIQTSGYSIHPNYTQPRGGTTAPTIAGYTATNMVHITTSDIAGVGKTIDAATRVGANNIHGIQFGVKDEQASRTQALREAARNARKNAEAMAAGLGMKAGRVVSISDSDPVQVIPYRREMMMAAQADAASTSIEPGNVQLRAVVTVTVELQ
jgi:uncharacterized protein YggE